MTNFISLSNTVTKEIVSPIINLTLVLVIRRNGNYKIDFVFSHYVSTVKFDSKQIRDKSFDQINKKLT